MVSHASLRPRQTHIAEAVLIAERPQCGCSNDCWTLFVQLCGAPSLFKNGLQLSWIDHDDPD